MSRVGRKKGFGQMVSEPIGGQDYIESKTRTEQDSSSSASGSALSTEKINVTTLSLLRGASL
jgi:hypothetical protein